MHRCLHCSAVYAEADLTCPVCGCAPEIIDGFAAFSPELAHAAPGFKRAYFRELAELEAGNFWFTSRNQLIRWAIDRYRGQVGSLLEIGCGTGFVLSGIAAAYPDARLTGSEVFTHGLCFAAERVPSARFIQMDARQIPFVEEFDVIGAFDVLEHIAEDEAVIAQTFDALMPGGVFLLTVPQHAWLWSSADDHACHVRRYSGRDLHAKLRHAGFRILRSTSFVFALLPMLMLARMTRTARPLRNSDVMAELKIPATLNSLFMAVTRLDLAVISAGADLPVGGSRLVVAQKLVQ